MITMRVKQQDGSIVDIPLGKGADGYTPVKGVDYYTEEDKNEIVQRVIETLGGNPIFGYVDSDNNIVVSGNLSDGSYILKYENEDGSYTDIGTLDIGENVVVNLLATALTPDDITTIFDGKGYKNGCYASAAEPFYNTDAAFFCSGLMVIPEGRTFYIKGCTLDASLSHTRFGLMMENGGTISTVVLSSWGGSVTLTKLGEQYYSVYIYDTLHDGMRPYYFYFSGSGTGEGVIVSSTPIE